MRHRIYPIFVGRFLTLVVMSVSTLYVQEPSVFKAHIYIFNSVQIIQSIMDEMAIVNSNVGSVEAEGFHIPEETKLLALKCLKGEMSFDDAINQIISEYRS